MKATCFVNLIVIVLYSVVHTLSAFHQYDSAPLPPASSNDRVDAPGGRPHVADELAMAMNDPTTL